MAVVIQMKDGRRFAGIGPRNEARIRAAVIALRHGINPRVATDLTVDEYHYQGTEEHQGIVVEHYA